MHTYAIQFLDAAGKSLETLYVTARSEFAAKAEAFRKVKVRDYESIEACRL